MRQANVEERIVAVNFEAFAWIQLHPPLALNGKQNRARLTMDFAGNLGEGLVD